MTIEQIRKLGKKRLKEVADFLEFNHNYLYILGRRGVINFTKERVIIKIDNSEKMYRKPYLPDLGEEPKQYQLTVMA